MENNIGAHVLRVCAIFNKNSVQYIIVGGAAVALHGYFRLSVDSTGAVSGKPDLDIWFNPSYDNYFRLLNALEELGQDVAAFKADQAPEPRKSFFKYEFEDFTLDLLPGLKATLRFRDSERTREVVLLNGTEIPFISLNDLIADKKAIGRAKDRADIEHLGRDTDLG